MTQLKDAYANDYNITSIKPVVTNAASEGDTLFNVSGLLNILYDNDIYDLDISVDISVYADELKNRQFTITPVSDDPELIELYNKALEQSDQLSDTIIDMIISAVEKSISAYNAIALEDRDAFYFAEFERDWADEFYVTGSYIMNSIERAELMLLANSEREVHLYFGTNEGWDGITVGQLIDSITWTKISESTYKELLSTVYKRGPIGTMFPTLEDLESRMSDEDF